MSDKTVGVEFISNRKDVKDRAVKRLLEAEDFFLIAIRNGEGGAVTTGTSTLSPDEIIVITAEILGIKLSEHNENVPKDSVQ